MKKLFKVKNLVLMGLFVMLPSLLTANQIIRFTPAADNTVIESSTDSNTANTVYANSLNTVGAVHSNMTFYNYVKGRSLIYFDLTPLVGKTIVEAYLKLFVVHLVGDPSGAATRTDYEVSAITQSWNTGTVTWNTMPSHSNAVWKIFEVPQAPISVIEVTQFVQYWMSGAMTNSGFMLVDAYECAKQS